MFKLKLKIYICNVCQRNFNELKYSCIIMNHVSLERQVTISCEVFGCYLNFLIGFVIDIGLLVSLSVLDFNESIVMLASLC